MSAHYGAHIDSMSKDYHYSNACSKRIEQMVLRDISAHVIDMGRDIRNYGLPKLHDSCKLINNKS
jgi:hypothetical protein